MGFPGLSTTKFAWVLMLSCVAMGGIGACGSQQTAEVKQEASLLEAEEISRAWQVRMMDNQTRARFESHKVWYHLVFKRDLQAAVRSLGDTQNMASARAHIEVATMYKMAAVLSANSLIETYGKTRQETDPAEVDHLLMMSYGLTGDLPNARKYAEMSGTKSPAVAVWAKPWILWLNEGANWPPDLSTLPLEVPDEKSGFWFDSPKVP